MEAFASSVIRVGDAGQINSSGIVTFETPLIKARLEGFLSFALDLPCL